MQIIRKVAAPLFAAAVVSFPAAMYAQIQPGTSMVGALDRTLTSKSTQAGQPFKLLNVNSSAYEINGATVYGHVAAVQSGGAGRKGEIKLALDKVNTRSGNIYKITGYATNVKANTKSNVGREAGAAAAGALVGGLLGRGVGAVLGATGGFLIAKNVHEDVTIPQGSLVTVQVTEARRQAQHP
jgi:hypothetical protein